MTLDNFWTLLSSKSPFLMVSWYCQFLLSGLQKGAGQELDFVLVNIGGGGGKLLDME